MHRQPSHASNDNVPATFDAYEASGEIEPNRGRCINIIAADIDPTVARNVALYYEQKEAPWADALAGRLRSAGGAQRRRAA